MTFDILFCNDLRKNIVRSRKFIRKNKNYFRKYRNSICIIKKFIFLRFFLFIRKKSATFVFAFGGKRGRIVPENAEKHGKTAGCHTSKHDININQLI